MNTRVRFAPAPTGYLHVGSARSALFNWLYARHTGGTFVLRIEDTNAELARPEFYDAITEPLQWLGLDWDEGPVLQSERTALYVDAIDRLLDSGAAYRCDCSRDDIDTRAAASGFKGGYDGFCRDRDVAEGDGVVVRFRSPDEGTTVVDDIVRGEVQFDNRELEDFVIRRSDGSPVFLVANAVDDADMAITHTVRGEDLLNTTPKVLLLWRALGLGPEPVYAHLPLLVGDDRKKLSKRRDSVALADFRDAGYLPEAMVNYLALLGWGAKDEVEVRPLSEIVEVFDLADVNKAPAFFDRKKLDHINGQYIRALSTDQFMAAADPWLTEQAPWPADRFDADLFARYLPLIQEKLDTLGQVSDYCDFLFLEDPVIDEASWTKAVVNQDAAPQILEGAIAALTECEWDTETVKDAVFGVGEALGVSRSKTQAPVRVAVTGRSVGPPLFETMAEFMSRDEVLRRLDAARRRAD
ncbi:MAG: glutamate--tRNA ligase [Acidimicrobiales bacterium]